MADKFVSRKEVCEILKISLSTLKRMETQGALVGTKGFGKEKFYLEEDVMALYQSLSDKIKLKKGAVCDTQIELPLE